MSYKEGTESYLLRFPPGLKARAEAAAQADGRTLSNWLINLIAKEAAKMAEYIQVDDGMRRVRYTTEFPSHWLKPPTRRIGDHVHFPMTEVYSDETRAIAVGKTGRIIGYDATTAAWGDRQFAYAVEVSWDTKDGTRVVSVIPADGYEVADAQDNVEPQNPAK